MIPNWNISGILPPIRPNKPGYDRDRSPYTVHMQKVVDRFAVSPERIDIISGLIEYRKALYNLGIMRGFQWLDGSFMENVELIQNRPPRDMDVVTFFHLPDGVSQADLAQMNPNLFMPKQAKAQYKVDAYVCILGEPTADYHVKMISYWYSMWSHSRNGLWKGFLQANLSSKEDEAALESLKLAQKAGDQ